MVSRQRDRQTARQTDSIDNGDPRQCSGGKLKMVMKMKSYEYHAPFASPRQVGVESERQVTSHVSAKKGELIKNAESKTRNCRQFTHTHTPHHE